MTELLSAPRLIINQKPKLVELTNQYSIRDENGTEIGHMQQEGQSKARKVLRFVTDVPVPHPNWRAWDFAIVDYTGREIGRIDKKFVGITKAIFTTADNYVVDIDPGLTGDARPMTLATAAAVDTALKQDARGFSVTDVLGT